MEDVQKNDPAFDINKAYVYYINNSRCWDYNHVVILFEVVVNVSKDLHGYNYEFVFNVDHSTGHNKTREIELSITAMTNFFGREQNKINDSKIKSESFLGPHEYANKLNVGNVQSIQFNENDEGPLNMLETSPPIYYCL